MPSLFVLRGRDQGTRFELTGETIRVGRDSANQIQVHDAEVSRCHAELRRSGDTFSIVDLDSSNRTFVNGESVTEKELTSGDQVRIGGTLLLFTGVTERYPEDLSGKVDIVARPRPEASSRIIRSMSQAEGSAFWQLGPGDDVTGDDVTGDDVTGDAVTGDAVPGHETPRHDMPGGEVGSPWLARARSNLQIMYRTALAVSHTLDIDQLLQRIMEMIFEWVDTDRGCIMLKQSESGDLEPRVRRHRRPSVEDKITISQTILDYVIDRNEGVLTSNAREDNRWDAAQSILQSGVREAICVPMQGRYDVVGAIYIDTAIEAGQIIKGQASSNKFSDEHLKLMIAIAHQAALAVEDTSYYKALVHAERLAATGQAIATLSHHIKNILQGIRSGSYLIELGLEDHDRTAAESSPDASKLIDSAATIRKGWQFVERNQERITSLVMDMLTFSKQREPEVSPSDLNAVTQDVVELMRGRGQESGVELKCDLDPQIPILLFDPENIHRAVLNIVSNAVDACEGQAGKHVCISTHYAAAEGVVEIRIADNGTGIAAEELENVFSVFVSHKGSGGTGLGLPVSQKIIKEHGGEIRVKSELGKGSLFTLALPATPAESPGGKTIALD